MTIEWDAEITEDRPNQLIAWRSVGGQVDNGGRCDSCRRRAAGAPRSTSRLRYNPPGGALGRAFARFFGESPEQQVYDDLRHFKQVMETGEVDPSPTAARTGGAAGSARRSRRRIGAPSVRSR